MSILKNDNSPYLSSSRDYEVGAPRAEADRPASPRRVQGPWLRVLSPDSGEVVVFLQGETLPDWATEPTESGGALGDVVETKAEPPKPRVRKPRATVDEQAQPAKPRVRKPQAKGNATT